MPELCVGHRCWAVPSGSNLLDALNGAGLNVPYSCRAGSCQACLVRCLDGLPDDARPEALSTDAREQGWRLACQCQVTGDLRVAVFDPQTDGVPAEVSAVHWLGDVLRLHLRPARALRYRAGQHLLLWLGPVARPYSLASLSGEDALLEFHIDCRRPGAFCDQARSLKVGDALALGALSGGALQYDPDWQTRPLWLLAAGTGLAPLWSILREALRQGHEGPIRILHVARTPYLAEALKALAGERVRVEQVSREGAEQALAGFQVLSRQTVALVCGSPQWVEQVARRLFLAGVPRNQVLAEVFSERA